MKLVVAWVVVMGWGGVALGDDVVGTLILDPVELVQGREVVGDEDVSTTHYRFAYLFASEKNKTEFEKHPEKYEIQLGGACGRMGALSGTGSPGIVAAHKGKVYIFASQSCRETFLRDPRKVLDSPDEVPNGTAEQKKRGAALIEKAVDAMGGASRIDAIRNYRYTNENQSESRGQTIDSTRTVTLAFPDRIRTDSMWGEQRYTKIFAGSKGWCENPDESFSYHAQQCEAGVKHYLGHNILAILKSRSAPGFVAVHDGSSRVEHNGQSVEAALVEVHAYGATSTLGIDPNSGRILTHSYRGQGPGAMFGQIEKRFTEFETVDGVLLPSSFQYNFDGESVDRTIEGEHRFELNVSLPADYFAHKQRE